MKNFLLIAVLIFIIGTLYGQRTATKGQTQFNAGVGFSSWGVPVYIGLDHRVHPNFSLGGELSYHSYDENYWYNSHDSHKYHHSIIGFSGNGNYHFNQLLNIPREWDFYAGLNIGFYVWNSPDDYPGSHTSGLGLGAQLGGRYYFSDNFGVNMEFGGNNAFSGGKIGITIKL